MKQSLLRSFLTVAAFWTCVSWVLFGFADPSENLHILQRLYINLPWLSTVSLPDKVSVLDGAWMQKAVLLHWTVPVLLLVGVLVLVGACVTGVLAYLAYRERDRRGSGSGEWRGVTVTRGIMPLPPILPLVDELHVDWTPAVATQLNLLSPEEVSLLTELLCYVAAHPEAYTGLGHGVSLLEHTVHVMDQVATADPFDPLVLLAAAAHDIGKVTSFKKDPDTGEWARIKWHDKESARLMALLPSYWGLLPTRRRALTLAVKYDHSPGKRPEVTPEVDGLAVQLMAALQQADRAATRDEKAAVVAEAAATQDLADTVFGAFMQALPTMPFSTYNQQKDLKAAGWRKGGRLYFIEHQVHSIVLEHLAPDLRAAWKKRKHGDMSELTRSLLVTFAEKGWLVTASGDMLVPIDSALWDIRAGKMEFRGIWAIEPSQDVLDCAPRTNSAYAIEILNPHFQGPSPDMAVAPEKLQDSGLLRAAGGSEQSSRPSRKRVSPQISRQLPGAPQPKATPADKPAQHAKPEPVQQPKPDAMLAAEPVAEAAQVSQLVAARPVDSVAQALAEPAVPWQMSKQLPVSAANGKISDDAAKVKLASISDPVAPVTAKLETASPVVEPLVPVVPSKPADPEKDKHRIVSADELDSLSVSSRRKVRATSRSPIDGIPPKPPVSTGGPRRRRS